MKQYNKVVEAARVFLDVLQSVGSLDAMFSDKVVHADRLQGMPYIVAEIAALEIARIRVVAEKYYGGKEGEVVQEIGMPLGSNDSDVQNAVFAMASQIIVLNKIKANIECVSATEVRITPGTNGFYYRILIQKP